MIYTYNNVLEQSWISAMICAAVSHVYGQLGTQARLRDVVTRDTCEHRSGKMQFSGLKGPLSCALDIEAAGLLTSARV